MPQTWPTQVSAGRWQSCAPKGCLFVLSVRIKKAQVASRRPCASEWAVIFAHFEGYGGCRRARLPARQELVRLELRRTRPWIHDGLRLLLFCEFVHGCIIPLVDSGPLWDNHAIEKVGLLWNLHRPIHFSTQCLKRVWSWCNLLNSMIA